MATFELMLPYDKTVKHFKQLTNIYVQLNRIRELLYYQKILKIPESVCSE